MESSKLCKQCNTYKPLTDFTHRNTNGKRKPVARCKKCLCKNVKKKYKEENGFFFYATRLDEFTAEEYEQCYTFLTKIGWKKNEENGIWYKEGLKDENGVWVFQKNKRKERNIYIKNDDKKNEVYSVDYLNEIIRLNKEYKLSEIIKSLDLDYYNVYRQINKLKKRKKV